MSDKRQEYIDFIYDEGIKDKKQFKKSMDNILSKMQMPTNESENTTFEKSLRELCMLEQFFNEMAVCKKYGTTLSGKQLDDNQKAVVEDFVNTFYSVFDEQSDTKSNVRIILDAYKEGNYKTESVENAIIKYNKNRSFKKRSKVFVMGLAGVIVSLALVTASCASKNKRTKDVDKKDTIEVASEENVYENETTSKDNQKEPNKVVPNSENKTEENTKNSSNTSNVSNSTIQNNKANEVSSSNNKIANSTNLNSNNNGVNKNNSSTNNSNNTSSNTNSDNTNNSSNTSNNNQSISTMKSIDLEEDARNNGNITIDKTNESSTAIPSYDNVEGNDQTIINGNLTSHEDNISSSVNQKDLEDTTINKNNSGTKVPSYENIEGNNQTIVNNDFPIYEDKVSDNVNKEDLKDVVIEDKSTIKEPSLDLIDDDENIIYYDIDFDIDSINDKQDNIGDSEISPKTETDGYKTNIEEYSIDEDDEDIEYSELEIIPILKLTK